MSGWREVWSLLSPPFSAACWSGGARRRSWPSGCGLGCGASLLLRSRGGLPLPTAGKRVTPPGSGCSSPLQGRGYLDPVRRVRSGSVIGYTASLYICLHLLHPYYILTTVFVHVFNFRLKICELLEENCKALSSLSSLRELDLSNCDLQDSGVTLLSAGLKRSQCAVETLSLSGCLITEEGCTSLASALSSNPSHLRELDLSYNHLGGSGIKLLSAGLKDPGWTLDTLRDGHTSLTGIVHGYLYSCQITIDTNTVNTKLQLSDNNRKVTRVEEVQSYPDHPDRFDFYHQLLCRNGLTGRCYWEVEWRGRVDISVSYRSIRRKGSSDDCVFGWNDQSWSLDCSRGHPRSVLHNNRTTLISSSSSSVSNRAAVYVDCSAGTLSFYRVSSDTLIHLHTFNTTFTQTLYPGFMFIYPGSSVSLC
uniref:B30.2/SPRY domain-containing protein n=1 Tax=Maylandia zebra TaxID=106582 RepID=A0A3P9DIY5_9CICH